MKVVPPLYWQALLLMKICASTAVVAMAYRRFHFLREKKHVRYQALYVPVGLSAL